MGFTYPEGRSIRTLPEEVAAIFDIGQKRPIPVLSLPLERKSELVQVREIIRIEADSCYVNLYLQNHDKVYCMAKTLKYFDTRLHPFPQFVRIHRSHIINIRYLRTVWRYQPVEVELHDGTKLPVSRRRCRELLKLLEAGW